jgi:hypothetical protein
MTYLAGGDYTVYATSPWWFETWVYVYAGRYESSTASGCVTLQGGAGYGYPVCTSGKYGTLYRGSWWGLPLTVRNINPQRESYMRVDVQRTG